MIKKLCLIVLVVVILTNVPPIKWVIGQEDLLYSNASGTFTFAEMNFTSRNYKMCMNKFHMFKAENKKDTVLYKLEPVNPLKFWRWGDYLTKEKYRLPYKHWEEIEARRGHVKNLSGFQDF
jgi:hypothetical protein